MKALKSLIAAVLVAVALSACGGGGSAQETPAPSPFCGIQGCEGEPLPKTVMFSQTASPDTVLVRDPGNASYFPLDHGFVATFDAGLIGLTVDERGVGIVNNSWNAPEGSDKIKAANYSWNPSVRVRPWANGGEATVCTSFTASVPTSIMQGSAGNYNGADIWLRDGSTGKPSSGKGIIVSSSFFFDDQSPYRAVEGGPFDYLASLNSVQIGAKMGGDMWVTTTGETLRTQPWATPAKFGFCINRAQVQRMTEASATLLGGVVAVEDIVLDGALISNEVNIGVPSSTDPAKKGSILASFFSDWVISTQGQAPAPVIPVPAPAPVPTNPFCGVGGC